MAKTGRYYQGLQGVISKLQGALTKQKEERPSYVQATDQMRQAAGVQPSSVLDRLTEAAKSVTPPIPYRGKVEEPPPVTHTVQPGETLWGMSQQYLGRGERWPEIRDYPANIPVLQEGLARFPAGDPRLEKPLGHWIFPGQEFAIPQEAPPPPPEPPRDMQAEAIQRLLQFRKPTARPEAPKTDIPINAINRFLEASKVDTVTGVTPKIPGVPTGLALTAAARGKVAVPGVEQPEDTRPIDPRTGKRIDIPEVPKVSPKVEEKFKQYVDRPMTFFSQGIGRTLGINEQSADVTGRPYEFRQTENMGDQVAEFLGGIFPYVVASYVTAPLGISAKVTAGTSKLLKALKVTPKVAQMIGNVVGLYSSGAAIGGGVAAVREMQEIGQDPEGANYFKSLADIAQDANKFGMFRVLMGSSGGVVSKKVGEKVSEVTRPMVLKAIEQSALKGAVAVNLSNLLQTVTGSVAGAGVSGATLGILDSTLSYIKNPKEFELARAAGDTFSTMLFFIGLDLLTSLMGFQYISPKQVEGWRAARAGAQAAAPAGQWEQYNEACRILGLDPNNITPETLKVAFRAAARKYHPDFGGTREQMAAANEARTVIEMALNLGVNKQPFISGEPSAETVKALPGPVPAPPVTPAPPVAPPTVLPAPPVAPPTTPPEVKPAAPPLKPAVPELVKGELPEAPTKEPWEMKREEFAANPPEGFKFDPNLKAEAQAKADAITVGPKFFNLPSNESKKAVIDHEIGHQLSDKMLADQSAFELADAGAFGPKRPDGTIDGINGQRTPGENVAEAYSVLQNDPQWLKQNYPLAYDAIARRLISEGKPVPREVLQDYAGQKWADEALAKMRPTAPVETVPTAEPTLTEAKPSGGLLSAEAKAVRDKLMRGESPTRAEMGVDVAGYVPAIITEGRKVPVRNYNMYWMREDAEKEIEAIKDLFPNETLVVEEIQAYAGRLRHPTAPIRTVPTDDEVYGYIPVIERYGREFSFRNFGYHATRENAEKEIEEYRASGKLQPGQTLRVEKLRVSWSSIMPEQQRIAVKVGLASETRVKPAEVAPKAEKGREIVKGEIVYGAKGEPLTVVDASDPAQLTVRNARGTEYKIGRKAVTTEKPVTSEKVKPPIAKPAESIRQIEESLSKEVDKAVGEVGIPMGQSVKIVGGTPKKVDDKFSFSDPEIEARYQAAHGVKTPSLWNRTKEMFAHLSRLATREYEHLPGGKEYAPLRFALRTLKKQRDVAADRTLRLQQGITIAFAKDPKGFSLFERRVLLNDLLQEAEADRPLPFGFTKEKLEAESERLDKAISNIPEIAEAIEKRAITWEALRRDYIEAMEAVGFDVAKKFTKKDYYRHMILDYASIRIKGTGERLRVPVGRSFLRERKGSILDINTNYLEAEYEVMAQMLYDIERAKTIKFIDYNYNIAEDLKIEAAKLNKGKPKEERIRWESLIPEGYTLWQPREGNVFFFADSIPAQLAEKLLSGTLESAKITAKNIRKVLAKGHKYREFVVKEEVASTLNNLTSSRKYHPISNFFRTIQTRWKEWTLISPKRWPKYNFRNASGDADAVFVGNPSTFLKVPQAVRELYRVFVGDAAMTKDMRAWFERGGMQTLLQVQEIGDINRLRMFADMLEKKGKITELPVKIWQGYWKAARISTDFREAILRYAAYLDFKEQLDKGNGRPRTFGASIPEEIMALKSNEDKAFELANDLLGGYDKISVLGKWLREYAIPFWSWNEINIKRYIQFAKNAANDGEAGEVIGRAFMRGLKRSPLIAWRIGKFVLKATALVTALHVWNTMFFPDEEKELPEDVRNHPHIVLGRDKDGKVLYFSRLGALGDFLEWFGMDETPANIRDFLNGKKSLKDIAVDIAKGPVNKVVQSVGPQFKTFAEIATGRSIFPDVFRPGQVRDRLYHLAEGLGLGDEYSYIRGLPRRPDYLKRFLVYTQEPGQGAYSDIRYNETVDYLKSKGKYRGMYESNDPKHIALYYLRLAIKYEDFEALKKFTEEYVMYGGTKDGLEQSLKMLHPLGYLNQEQRNEFVNKWLDDEGRERLKLAEKFYYETVLGHEEGQKGYPAKTMKEVSRIASEYLRKQK